MSRSSTLVVFDNNAYRDLTSHLPVAEVDQIVLSLNRAQQAHGHVVLASSIVALELVARMRQPGTPAFNAAMRAVVALVGNCREFTAPASPIRMLQEPDTNLCRALFDRLPPDAKENLDRLTGLLNRIDQVRSPDLGADALELIGRIARHVDERERSFIADTFKHLVKPFNPDVTSWEEVTRRPDLSRQVLQYLSSDDWLLVFSEMLVLKAADILSLKLSERDLAERATWLAPYVLTPHALYTEAVRRVLLDGARLTRDNRANWFWDVYILFGIGSGHTSGGKPIILVTSDADMVAAASRSGAAALVETCDDYLARISYALA